MTRLTLPGAGFVHTPFHQWPQVEQSYSYAYISRAIKPLGRIDINESMLGAKNPDLIWGYDGNDTIQGGNGNDTINGGAGTDTAVYLGNKVNYIISKISAGYTVTDNTGTEGTDTLISIEDLSFQDGLYHTSMLIN
jgi:Ca2+-binding RTX toxin-like protein